MSPKQILETLDRILKKAGPEDTHKWILALSARTSALAARSLTGEGQRTPAPTPAGAQDGEPLMGIPEAAEMLGVKVRWVREHLHELPAIRLSKRQIRFEPKRLRRYIAARQEAGR